MKKDYIFTPGPTPVPPAVGLSQVRMVHHRSPDFGELLGRVLEGLKYVFQTDSEVLLITSSGTGAMEGAVANCFSPGDKVAVFCGGKFGERLAEISDSFGLEVIRISYQWGESADPLAARKVLEENRDLKGVMLTQSETSTGVVNDVEAFGRLVAQSDALFVVDAISGLGAVQFKTDDWNVDVAVGGSQKALMTPPGLSFAALSEKAWKAVERATLPRYYFCFKTAREAQEKNPPQTPFTPAITLVQALAEAIEMIKREGLAQIFERHRLLAEATQAAVEALGLEFVAADRSRAFVTTSVWSPEGIDSGDMVRLMRNQYGVFIAGGQGKLKGKIFRLGHVGFFDYFDIVAQVSALEMALVQLGYRFEVGSGIAAALRVLVAGQGI
ncbi:MAG: alanine--glyoxylate aminotransferase family protein [Actinomycetia bacterium]|nr:alanine--glyoxylate aminotransferase family protein [Actinomycetes bacterium]